jgi:hypothetical protein
VVLFLVLGKTGSLEVEFFLFLLLLDLELLVDLIEFFEGDATRATSCSTCAA